MPDLTHETVPAPPVAFRETGMKQKTSYTTGGLESSCDMSMARLGLCGSDTYPGYNVQWPYLQTQVQGVTQVAQSSSTFCAVAETAKRSLRCNTP